MTKMNKYGNKPIFDEVPDVKKNHLTLLYENL